MTIARSEAMTNVRKSCSLIVGLGFGFLASAVIPRNAWALEFSGFQWDIKDGNESLLGPGPNRFRRENVFVDATGRLHLLIRRDRNGTWSCAEVILRQPITYGTFTMLLDTPLDTFHPQSVLGFFTWSDRWPNNEMDIEIARFRGLEGGNVFFSVQPNTLDFSLSGSAWDQSEHSFVWSRGIVYFSSIPRGRGNATVKPLTSNIRVGVPRPTLTTGFRLNFWLRGGAPPRGVTTDELEVVIAAVRFKRS